MPHHHSSSSSSSAPNRQQQQQQQQQQQHMPTFTHGSSAAGGGPGPPPPPPLPPMMMISSSATFPPRSPYSGEYHHQHQQQQCMPPGLGGPPPAPPSFHAAYNHQHPQHPAAAANGAPGHQAPPHRHHHQHPSHLAMHPSQHGGGGAHHQQHQLQHQQLHQHHHHPPVSMTSSWATTASTTNSPSALSSSNSAGTTPPGASVAAAPSSSSSVAAAAAARHRMIIAEMIQEDLRHPLLLHHHPSPPGGAGGGFGGGQHPPPTPQAHRRALAPRDRPPQGGQGSDDAASLSPASAGTSRSSSACGGGGGGASTASTAATSTATAGSAGQGGGAGGGAGSTTPRLVLLPRDGGASAGASGSRSFDSAATPHEVAAASVLLLAATAMKESCSHASAAIGAGLHNCAPPFSQPARDGVDGGSKEAEEGPELKKRKQAAAGIMRKKSSPDAVSLASHVSPCSTAGTPAASGSGDGPRPGKADASGSNRGAAAASPPRPGSSPSSSYDLRDGQALHDSAKIHDPKEIALVPSPPPPPPPAPIAAPHPHHSPAHQQVAAATIPKLHKHQLNHQRREIPHFPSVLHAVLTESEFAGKVLLWLPHGQAWRIVRWDALRRSVLPKYFAQLNDDDGAAPSKDAAAPMPSGSIDAFLWHLSAWGFEEVNEGPDVGAYAHVLFRRELPGLCREMRFNPADGPNNKAAESTAAPDKDPRPSSLDAAGVGARYILQVPSLGSTTGAAPPASSSDPAKLDPEGNGGAAAGARLPSLASYPNQVTPGWPSRPQVSLGYPLHPFGGGGSGASASADPHRPHQHHPGAGAPWKHYPEPSQWIGSSPSGAAAGAGTPSSISPQRSVPPYSPIRVRSGRGAARLPLGRGARTAPEADGGAGAAAAPVSGAAAGPSRSSFPVSNRGKGGRPAVLRRLSHPGSGGSLGSLQGGGIAEAADGTVGAGGDKKGEAVLSPNSVADGGAAAGAASAAHARPRASILKRRLPLARNTSSSGTAAPAAHLSSSPSYSADDDATAVSAASSGNLVAGGSSPRDLDGGVGGPLALLALAHQASARVGMSAEDGEEKKEEDGPGVGGYLHRSRAGGSESPPAVGSAAVEAAQHVTPV